MRRVVASLSVAFLAAGCASPGPPSVTPESPAARAGGNAPSFCLDRRHAPPVEDPIPDEAFSSDGCSCWPDGSWLECCVRHDEAYWRGGSWMDRFKADAALARCVARGEWTRWPLAAAMFVGVRLGGASFLPTPFRWGYGWHWPRSGP